MVLQKLKEETKMENRVFTIPNILTMLRLAMIPFFVFAFVNGYEWTALSIFVIASITDVVDGYIARRYNLITNLGKLLDPLADKLLRIATIVLFAYYKIVPVWMVSIMVIFDLSLILASAFLFKHQYIVCSNKFGKIAGFFSLFSLFLCFFYDYVAPFHIIFLGVSLLLIFISIISYIIQTVKKYPR